jgi:hypothetical protein
MAAIEGIPNPVGAAPTLIATSSTWDWLQRELTNEKQRNGSLCLSGRTRTQPPVISSTEDLLVAAPGRRPSVAGVTRSSHAVLALGWGK